MKVALRTAQIVVLDDVLEPAHFEALWKHTQLAKYRSVHAEGWEPVWRPLDGQPLTTADVFSEPGDEAGEHYPTGTGIDHVIRAIGEHAHEFAEHVGVRGEAWSRFTASSYLYSAGARLSWHKDREDKYTGSYAFYAHPTWNVQWGGELLVADESTRGADTSNGEQYEWDGKDPESLRKKRIRASLSNERENEVLLASGVGTYVVPKPNRLVVIAGHTTHMINQVHAAAGDRVRCSVAGFFLAKR
jgi:hypothetical protein